MKIIPKSFLAAVAALSWLAPAPAAFVQLDPGVPLQLFSSNFNDGYESRRGAVFQADESFTLQGAGLWTDLLASTSFTWSLWSVGTYPGQVNQTLLAKRTIELPDGGLDFYDATFTTPLTLNAGGLYHIEVSYTTDAQSNYFMLFDSGAADLGPVTVRDGTHSGYTTNSVMPLIRLQMTQPPAVPEPTTVLFGAALLGVCAFARRRARSR